MVAVKSALGAYQGALLGRSPVITTPNRVQSSFLTQTHGQTPVLATRISSPITSMPRFEGDNGKPKRMGFFQSAMETVVFFYGALLALAGGGYIYNERVGDGPIPELRPVNAEEPDWSKQVRARETLHLQHQSVSDEARWQGLQPALAVLDKTLPEVSAWVRDRHQQNLLVFNGEGFGMDGAIAAYQPSTKTLFVNEYYWGMNTGNQAGVLAHEFRHSLQNLPKTMAVKVGQLITGDFLKYPSLIEDEAFQYQSQYLKAIGLKPTEIEFYLKERHIHH
jgi:hypothetical protein